MKPNLNKMFLTMVAAASLPTCAYAGTEMISAGFERSVHCNLSTTTVVIVDTVKEFDPMEAAVKVAVNSTDDPVLASYYRDLYRAPTSKKTMKFVRKPDPYVDAISIALYGSAEPDSRLVC